MTISTLFYFYDNTEDIEEVIKLENEIDLSDFYLNPPDSVVNQAIAAVLNS